MTQLKDRLEISTKLKDNEQENMSNVLNGSLILNKFAKSGFSPIFIVNEDFAQVSFTRKSNLSHISVEDKIAVIEDACNTLVRDTIPQWLACFLGRRGPVQHFSCNIQFDPYGRDFQELGKKLVQDTEFLSLKIYFNFEFSCIFDKKE